MPRLKKEYLPEEDAEVQDEDSEESVQKVEKKEKEEKEEKSVTSKNAVEQIEALLKSKKYKGRHFGIKSWEDIEKQDLITTGSFWFDLMLGGGFRSGTWARFSGDPETGKTSQGLCWMKNWIEKYPDDGFGVIFNAEGRVNRDLIERSGLSQYPKNFRLIPINEAESIWGLQENLIMDNPGKHRYFFFVDVIDAMERREDKEKGFDEATKIMGGGALISAAAKRLSLLYSVDGHFLYVSNQLRAVMSKGLAGPTKSPSGGNALRYYASLVGSMKKPWSDTFIYKEPNIKKPEIEENGVRKPNILGVEVQIKLEKTPNEKTGQTVSFPIKYGLTGAYWRAYEAMQICIYWGKYTRASSSSSFVIEPDFAKELTDNNISFIEKPRTNVEIRDMFDTNPQLTDFVIQYFRNLLLSNAIQNP